MRVLDHRGGDRADHVRAGVQGGRPGAHLGQQWRQRPQLSQQRSLGGQPAITCLHSVIQVSCSSRLLLSTAPWWGAPLR